MIWSSRARNRSFEPVVSCCFGRIVPSDAARESCFASKRNRKMKSQASRASDPETLQSQTRPQTQKRLSLNGLEIVHGRLGRSTTTAEEKHITMTRDTPNE